jgi:hypothetical protein
MESWMTMGTVSCYWDMDKPEEVEWREPEKPKYEVTEYKELLGRRMVEVTINDARDVMRFVSDDGLVVEFYHAQDCCEYVSIIDVVGDLDDLVGVTLFMAEEVIYEGHNPEGVEIPENYQDSWTWTFYKFGTMKGYVTIRWYGASNGYYSERVDVMSYRLVHLQ